MSREELSAILSQVKPGKYLSRDLLPEVNDWLNRNGRQPISAKKLGERLRRVMGFRPCGARRGNSIWLITPEAIAGRDWFKP